MLLFMACVEIVFYHLDNHLKQVYFVNFETKLKENVNENIFHAARNAGYEVFCDPKFLESIPPGAGQYGCENGRDCPGFPGGLRPLFCIRSCACVSCEGGSGAILFCLFSLVYSFLAGSIGEKIKYTFNHATTMAAPHFKMPWAICQTRSQFFSRMDFLLNVFGSLSSCRRKPRRIRRKSGKQVSFSEVGDETGMFCYSPEKRVLQNIDLCIHKGEKVAVVGRNGSGKTTLIKLSASPV